MFGYIIIFEYFYDKGYDVMYIISKFGVIINDKKVGCEEFFQIFIFWGVDDICKFVIFYYFIFFEGINVFGLMYIILLCNLFIVEMVQMIGCVICVYKDDCDVVV